MAARSQGEGTVADTHHVFVSHRHEDDAHIEGLKALLAGKDVTLKDSSITNAKPNQAKNPDYIMNDIIKPRIDWAGTLMVLISPDTKNHEWVDKEIEYALEKGKQIIGVFVHGAADCDIPASLMDNYDDLVGWNADKIVNALNRERVLEGPDGKKLTEKTLARVTC
jgi:hypothetical protein